MNYLHNTDTMRQLVRVYSEEGKIDSVSETSLPKGKIGGYKYETINPVRAKLEPMPVRCEKHTTVWLSSAGISLSQVSD